MSMTTSRATIVTPPKTEPITLTEARRQISWSQNDNTHDAALSHLIQAAREQWEHDTDSSVLTQTLRCTAEGFYGDCIELPRGPIQSITSITYYDSANVQQTLSSSIYNLNAEEREVELAYLQVWPPTVYRWDAVTVNYVAGYSSVANVPAIAKQAMMLLIGFNFTVRDMLVDFQLQTMEAYERLVRRFMRRTYP